MRKWLANKLYFLAFRMDREETLVNAQITAKVADAYQRLVVAERAKPKRGRPKGAKDGVGPKPAPKKRGRPLGSKNKPKGPVA
jgi:hypothetical protein